MARKKKLGPTTVLERMVIEKVVALEPIHRDMIWKQVGHKAKGPKAVDLAILQARDRGMIRKNQQTGLWESTAAGCKFVNDRETT